jgi:drug/metabolite transporter (DMT)-like permease
MSSEEATSQKDGGTQTAGEGHKMSIALTIGATIALIGLILLLYGLFGNANYTRSDGININFWWGLLMLVFGLLMSAGGYIASKRTKAVTH